ncbi:MAG TPA: CHAT domain-containing tetratricopeptide repeat protein [Thermoanaerobaculia bacterium]|nr:CHAT domain-containing tetratricopeptide repeat protein [Thermoanaerobaculia bacterium]
MAVLTCGGPPAAPPERIVLAPGSVLSRSLPVQGPYRFRFAVAADRFVHLEVEQRGVDVVVALEDPNGHRLYEIDSPTGDKSPEPVLMVTPVSGNYLLVVERLKPSVKSEFALRVREVRPAEAKERTCAAAAIAFTDAERHPPAGDAKRTASFYRDLLPRLEVCGEPGWQARAEEYLGEALLQTDDLLPAAAILESSAARFQRLADGTAEARVLNQVGAARRALGEPDQALAAYQRALQLTQAAKDEEAEASTRNNLGLVYKNTGDLQGAIVQYETALGLWRRLGIKSSSEAVTRENLGSLYALIGHDAEALDLLQKARDQLASEKDPSPRILVLIALGWAQYLAGQPEAALERYQEALALAESSGSRQALPGLFDRRGTALRALHRYDEAAASYAQALAAIQKTGSKANEGHTLANLGWLDLEIGAFERARPRLVRSRELLAASGDPNGETYALIGLSRAERRLGDLGAARQHLETAIRLVETVRTGLRGSMSRGTFLADHFDAYEDLVSLLMELDRRQPAKGHSREALEVAERGKARNLVEAMQLQESKGTRDDTVQSGASVVEIAALEERRRMIAARDPHDPHLQDLDAALRSRSLELDRLAAAPAPPASFASVAEIQALTDKDSLVVEYLLAEPASFAWTVDRGTVVAHVLPGRERIEKLARRVVAALPLSSDHATQETVARVTRELAETILTPLGQRLAGRRRLIILPDGALHLIPFGTLPAAAEKSDPLLVQHEIVMLPSATALLAQRRRLAGRPLAPETLAALADPVFSMADERLATGNSRSAARVVTGDQVAEGIDVSLHRLPYTAEETRAIARLVPPKETLLALGTAANRDLVLSGALRRFRILHFATHGLLDPVLPERSGVVLSLFDDKGKRRDGFLSAPDVAALDLPAELAVLSACQTALGRELRGEGLVGLTQAFFRAGVRGVVVGYWNVDDRATSALMATFYRNLLVEHMQPAAALRAAQLAIRSEDRWRLPYYWAGFSFHGDWRQELSSNPTRR